MADVFNSIFNNKDNEQEQINKEKEMVKLKDIIVKELPKYVNQQNIFGVSDPHQLTIIKGHAKTIVNKTNTFLRPFEVESLISSTILEITSLGKLSPLMEDSSISEIMINSYDEIWIDRGGAKVLTDIKYSNDNEVLELARRIANHIGRRIDVSHPMVDARLPDGSRVNIIIPPASRKGTTITIRKFFKEKIGIEDLVKFETVTPEMARFLERLVRAKATIMVSGGTGSGKTTTLNVLSNFIPDSERIITIEDSAELQLNNAHVVSLETKDANAEGRGLVTIQDLVRNSLRMFPDRIIIGELRDATAYNFLQAANTGHEGSMATVHSDDPDSCIDRLLSLVLEGDTIKDNKEVRKMIGKTLDIVVQITRMPDKKRRIEYISEVLIDEEGRVTTRPVFQFHINKTRMDGTIDGEYVHTNNQLSKKLGKKFVQNNISLN